MSKLWKNGQYINGVPMTDKTLSTTSENPISNKAVTEAVNGINSNISNKLVSSYNGTVTTDQWGGATLQKVSGDIICVKARTTNRIAFVTAITANTPYCKFYNQNLTLIGSESIDYTIYYLS